MGGDWCEQLGMAVEPLLELDRVGPEIQHRIRRSELSSR